MTQPPVMVPVLVSFTGTAEVMIAEDVTRAAEGKEPREATVRTALAYVTPEGFTIDRIDDWEMLPS